jgi:hypothetical protein
MQQGQLAQQFNDAGRTLSAAGHRVVVRRARAMLEADDARGAVEFLLRARDAVGPAGGSVGGLVDGLQSFLESGGSTRALVVDPAWVEGTATESRASRLIDAATAGDGRVLLDQLVGQQRALATGEVLKPTPSGVMVPSSLPPLPGRMPAPAPASAATPEAPDPSAPAASAQAAIGSIEPVKRGPAAVVEAPNELTERPLELDNPVAGPGAEAKVRASAEPAPVAPPAIEPPMAAPTPEAPPADDAISATDAALADFGLRAAAEDAASAEDGPAAASVEEIPAAPAAPHDEPAPAVPELHRPQEMQLSAPPKKQSSGAGITIAAALILLGAAAAWYFGLIP